MNLVLARHLCILLLIMLLFPFISLFLLRRHAPKCESTGNYTAWSKEHIQPWCDVNTAACLSVKWPPLLPTPTLQDAFLERLHLGSNKSTRPDCIARSSMLHVNSTTNVDHGHATAVTCDIYDFGMRKRHHECVCFPVFVGTVTATAFADDSDSGSDDEDDDARVRVKREAEEHHITPTTPASYYPPQQVVKRQLRDAAIQGPPQTCTASCSKAAMLLEREPPLSLVPGKFPYCPPTHKAHGLAAGQTPAMTDPFDTIHATPTFPKCPHNVTKSLKSSCSMEQCLWQYTKNVVTATSEWVTTTDKAGSPIYAFWKPVNKTWPSTHWGSGYRKPAVGLSTCSSGLQWPSMTARAITAGNMTPLSNTKKIDACATSILEPECTDRATCTTLCAKQHAKHLIFIHALWGAVIGIAATGLLGLIAKLLYLRWKRKTDQKEYKPRYGIEPPSVDTNSRPGAVERDASVERGRRHSRTSAEASPATLPMTELAPNPLKPALARDDGRGSLRRAAEEGRVLPKVRFTPSVASDSSSGIVKLTGRDAEPGPKGEGVRGRLPSTAETL